jgi:hypothetical protein
MDFLKYSGEIVLLFGVYIALAIFLITLITPLGKSFHQRYLVISSCLICVPSAFPLYLIPIAATSNRYYTIVPFIGTLGLISPTIKETGQRKKF